MARIVETEAGRLIGRVDRAHRRVTWSLVCPECSLEIPLNAATFTGKQGALCACGYRAEPFDFELPFETAPPSTAKAEA